MEIYILNDYSVAQSDYNNKLYRVTARDLTDGRSDTGGWGSETAKIGNYIQATYSRPVYVTSVTLAGGFIPSWGKAIKAKYGRMDLEYSLDGKTWLKVITQFKHTWSWAYGKEKIRGAERNFPDFFGLCPRCQKKFSGETFQNCCRRGGGGGVITKNSY